MRSEPRVAFVTDALPSLGGSEKVLFAALEAIPQADVFTLVYNRAAFAGTPLAGRHVHTSILDKFPWAHRNHRILLPLMPAAIQGFDLHEYDVVVSFSYAVAHGARAAVGARHVSYTYTPMRYAWNGMNMRGERKPKNAVLGLILAAFRAWDRRAADDVDRFAAVSRFIAGRVRAAYLREAEVMYPPVEVDRFSATASRAEYYVTVSRLVAHKRVELIVEAFTRLGLSLLVIGEGPELPRLRKLAGANVQFCGFVPDKEMAGILSRARGFVAASEEDFGIAMVEAQAAGCPVIAYGRGGALETVIEGRTGIFFDEQRVETLSEAVQRFERRAGRWDPEAAIENAGRFSRERFLKEFGRFTGALPGPHALPVAKLPLPLEGFK